MSMFYKLLIKRRSIRHFEQKPVPLSIIKKAVNAARVSPSAANRQFLEYLVVDKKDLCEKIFSFTKWAGYLYPDYTPSLDESAAVYFIILINKEKTKKVDLRDVGIAGMSIIITLFSFGIGSCWAASVNKRKLRKLFNIPKKYSIDSLIAAGYPAEKPKLKTSDSNIKYWLDKKGNLNVPKRSLKSIFHYNHLKQ